MSELEEFRHVPFEQALIMTIKGIHEELKQFEQRIQKLEQK